MIFSFNKYIKSIFQALFNSESAIENKIFLKIRLIPLKIEGKDIFSTYLNENSPLGNPRFLIFGFIY
ncbi:hypothetical protein BWD42_01060 [Sphingobacterium sp. CZ-UAM]|nr:hypothetical protein BWD42_01060 [Sphingobacterium sp. CZ-UAM]